MTWIVRTPNNRWKARYRLPGGGTRSRTWDRKVDAERWLRGELSLRDRGDWVDPKLGRTVFEDWAPRWEAGRVHLRESTRAAAESLMRRHVLPYFGSAPVGAITPTDVQAFVSRLVGLGLAPSTIRQAYLIVAGVLRSAAESGLISRSPCRRVQLPQRRQRELRLLTPTEITRLGECIDSEYRSMVLIAAYAGLRWGEVAALRVSRLDFMRRSLTVEETLSDVKGVVRFTKPKSKASRRHVALPRFLAKDLANHLNTFSASIDNLLFSAPEGGPLRRTNFRRRVWLPAVATAGLSGVRFHDLRHTHAALLIAQGEHPKVIQGRLGHASITVTLDTYGHLFEGLDEAAADRLDDLVAPPARPRVVA